MGERSGLKPGAPVRTWMLVILVILVAGNVLSSSLAHASSTASAREEQAVWGPASPDVVLSGAPERNESERNDDARVRRGKRLRRGALPFTAPTIPLWVVPLIIASGLGLIALGAAAVTGVNERNDEEGLREIAKRWSATNGSCDAREETPVEQAQSVAGIADREHAASDGLRSEARAWRALGHGSRAGSVGIDSTGPTIQTEKHSRRWS
jgi:hypothetical protein